MYRADHTPDRERVSIVEIGDSHTASDAFSAQLREHLQARLGAAGRGYTHPGRPWPGFRQEDVDYDMGGHWESHLAVDSEASGPFGLGGVRLETTAPGAWVERSVCEHCSFAHPFEVVAVHYLRHPEGGRVEVQVDGRTVDTIDTSGSTGLEVYRTSRPSGGSTLRLEVLGGGGRVSLFGIHTYRRVDGVTYSSVGLNGADVRDFVSLDRRFVRAQLRELSPDLLVFSFGTNGAYNLYRFARQEGANRTLVRRRFERYRRDFRQLLKRHLSAAPGASCLVLLPPDMAPPREACPRGEPCPPRRPESFQRVVDIQRSVGTRLGCAFWHRAAAMGGAGSIREWARDDTRWARDDGIHLTIDGYQSLADGLFQDLTRAYGNWTSGFGSPELETEPIEPLPAGQTTPSRLFPDRPSRSTVRPTTTSGGD